MSSSTPLTFLQRVVIKGWKSLFEPGSAYNLPEKIQDNAGRFDNYPADPADPEAKGFDLGVPIPDGLGLLTIGAVAQGNAQGFLPSGGVSGLSSLAPKVDPDLPDQAGIVFGSETGSTSTASISLKVKNLEVDSSWAIRQKQIYTGGCAAGPLLFHAGIENSDSALDALRKFRTDLETRGGAMGAWLVEQYNTHQTALFGLLNLDRWRQAVDQYDGFGVWASILTTLNLAQDDQPVTIPKEQIPNALALVSAALQASLGQGEPEFQRFAQALRSLLPFFGDYSDADSYEMLISTIAGQNPPDDSGVAPTRTLPSASQELTTTWTGRLNGEAETASGKIDLEITAQADDQPPVVVCTGISISIPSDGWSFSFSGDDFFSKIQVFLLDVFRPSATDEIDETIEDEVKDSQEVMDLISGLLTEGVAELWNAEP